MPLALLVAGIEMLEGRITLDAGVGALAAAKVSLVGGTLTVQGTEDADRIAIGLGRGGAIRVLTNGTTSQFSGVSQIEVLGGGGNDVIRVGRRVRLPGTIDGGEGNDRIEAIGSSAYVHGGGGDDLLIGGGNGGATLDGGTGGGRVVFASAIGTLRVGATASGELLDLLDVGYRLAKLQARTAATNVTGPIVVGPADLSDVATQDALKAAYNAGQTVSITNASLVQAQRLAAIVGHGTGVSYRDGVTIGAMVALRKVARPGGVAQFETSVVLPTPASANPATARAARERQLESLTAVFATSPKVAATGAVDPGNLLSLTNSYIFRGNMRGANGDFVQNVTTAYGVRSFLNQSDFYYIFQETDLFAAEVLDKVNSANIYTNFGASNGQPTLIQPTPQTTLNSTTVTSGVSFTIGGSVGFNAAQGVNASISGGVTISNSTSTTYPPINIANRANFLTPGNPYWVYSVNPTIAPSTQATTITAIDNFVWQVPFSIYLNGAPTLAFGVQVEYSTSANSLSVNLPVDGQVPLPFGMDISLKPPVVSSLSQTSVSPGQVFNIKGSGFYPSLVTNVLVGGNPTTFQAVNDSTITVVASGSGGEDLPVVVLTTQGVSNDNVTIDIDVP